MILLVLMFHLILLSLLRLQPRCKQSTNHLSSLGLGWVGLGHQSNYNDLQLNASPSQQPQNCKGSKRKTERLKDRRTERQKNKINRPRINKRWVICTAKCSMLAS